jgi:uncharacterized protein
MPGVEVLYRLQAVDLQLEEIARNLQDVETRLGDDAALQTARERVEVAERDLHQTGTEMREREWEVSRLDEKLTEANSSLFGGKVRNPKELTNLQKEVDSLRQQKRKHEDAELELMSRLEAQQAELTEARARLGEVETTFSQEHQELLARKAELENALATQQATRESLARSADPAHLPVYDRLRRQRAGRAVARVEQNLCGGCRVFLAVNLVQRARTNPALTFCGSCGRILYVGR